jgi:hypothetical protein
MKMMIKILQIMKLFIYKLKFKLKFINIWFIMYLILFDYVQPSVLCPLNDCNVVLHA